MLNKKNVFLHVGIGKTGTTALQKNLFKTRQANSSKYFYPNIGIQDAGHRQLAKENQKKIPENIRKMYQLIINNFKRVNTPNMIISSEFLYTMKPGFIKELSEIFNKFDTKIIFSIRNQLDLIPSVFLEWVKDGLDYENTINSFYESHKESFDFEGKASVWIKYFGEQALIFKLYDKNLIKENITLDFLNSININNCSGFSNADYNPSILPEFAKFLTFLDKWQVKKQTRYKLVKRLIFLSSKFKNSSKSKILNKKLKQRIIKNHRESNIRIANKYLNDIEARHFLRGFINFSFNKI